MSICLSVSSVCVRFCVCLCRALAAAMVSRWWSSQTVAVVTGANKGLGREIVRRLATEGLTVILTARNESRGTEAVLSLHAQGLQNVVFRRLDIRSSQSRTDFADWIRENYGGFDILVNNAAVFHDDNEYETAVETVEINYKGTVEMIRLMMPLMQSSTSGAARIVNVSSSIGRLMYVNNEELKKKLSDITQFDEQFLDTLAQEFLDACKAGDGGSNSYANTAYRFSKILLNSFTRLLALRLSSSEGHHQQIQVHNVHPGFVMTGMHRHFFRSLDEESYRENVASGKFGRDGAVTVEEGADTPVWLCLLPPGDPTPSGLLWDKRQVMSYY